MARITFAPVIYSQYKRQDGTYSVRMRITFKQKSKFVTTSESAQPWQLTRSLAVKDPELSRRLLVLQQKMMDAVKDLDIFTLEQMDLDDVIAYIKRQTDKDKKIEFFAFWEEAVASKPQGSRDNYMIALRNFKRFIGLEEMDIRKVTSRLMREYQASLEKKYGVGARAVTMYTASVRYVYNLARKKYNDEESGEEILRNPFDYYTPPRQKPAAHRDVDISVIQTMIDTRTQLVGRERRAVDAFLLSFALMGMNAPDLLSCSAPKDGVIIYHRQKTRDRRDDNAEMHVRIEPEIMPIFREWQEINGQDYAFTFHRIYSNHRQFRFALAKGITTYRQRMGIPEKGLEFYSARHTWATLAYNNAGIDKHTINDALCHVDTAMKVTDIYIKKDWSVVWEANRKVLSLFNWHNGNADSQVHK